MEFKNKAIDWTDKLEKTTKLLLDLQDNVKLPNGWGKRELLIHLLFWDDEMESYSDHLRKGNTFDWGEYLSSRGYDPEGKDLDKINQSCLDDNEDLSYSEALEAFTETRMKLINTYRDLIENYFIEEKSFTDYFSMWYHDVHHLKKAGVDTKELEEE